MEPLSSGTDLQVVASAALPTTNGHGGIHRDGRHSDELESCWRRSDASVLVPLKHSAWPSPSCSTEGTMCSVPQVELLHWMVPI